PTSTYQLYLHNRLLLIILISFFFNPTPTTQIYTLSLHDALPISGARPAPARAWRGSGRCRSAGAEPGFPARRGRSSSAGGAGGRSEEHTSELQSLRHLVCRLLLEKKKNK